MIAASWTLLLANQHIVRLYASSWFFLPVFDVFLVVSAVALAGGVFLVTTQERKTPLPDSPIARWALPVLSIVVLAALGIWTVANSALLRGGVSRSAQWSFDLAMVLYWAAIPLDFLLFRRFSRLLRRIPSRSLAWQADILAWALLATGIAMALLVMSWRAQVLPFNRTWNTIMSWTSTPLRGWAVLIMSFCAVRFLRIARAP